MTSGCAMDKSLAKCWPTDFHRLDNYDVLGEEIRPKI